MAQKLSTKQKREATVSAIRKYWDSADSHLDWCIERNPAGKDPRVFHIDTLLEYLEEMVKLAKTLK